MHIYLCVHVFWRKKRKPTQSHNSAFPRRLDSDRGKQFVGASDLQSSHRRKSTSLSKAPKGNGIGATGSKNPGAY